jgi:nickel-type superoxide dismutase maturation protease
MTLSRVAPVARYALLLAGIAAGCFLGTAYLARPWVISGSSMEPELAPGDRVIVDLWSYRHRAPRVGEVALVLGPSPSDPPLVKRVAATPAGELWLLGDNEAESLDSRAFGSVPRRRARGRVVIRYWPPSRAGRIR